MLTVAQKQDMETYAEALVALSDQMPETFKAIPRSEFERFLTLVKQNEVIESLKLIYSFTPLINRDLKTAKNLVDSVRDIVKKSPLILPKKSFLEDIKDTKLENSKKEFCRLKVERSVEGLNISITSKSLEEFARRASSRPELNDSPGRDLLRNSAWPNVYGYHFPTHSIFNQRAVWGGPLIVNGYANLGFLCIKGIKEGATVNVRGLYTESQLTEFRAKFKSNISELYREFMKPFAQELVVHYEEL